MSQTNAQKIAAQILKVAALKAMSKKEIYRQLAKRYANTKSFAEIMKITKLRSPPPICECECDIPEHEYYATQFMDILDGITFSV